MARMGYAVVMAAAANNKILTPAFAFQDTGVLTIALWIFGNVSTSIQMIYEPAGIYPGFYISANTTTITMNYKTTIGQNVYWTNALTGYLDVWTFLVLRYDAPNLKAELFVDNVSQGVKTLAAGATFPTNSDIKSFGSRGGAQYWFIGKIDEPLIYNSWKSDAWITASYNTGAGLYTSTSADLEVGYHLDENTGTTLNDLSSNNRDGTLGSANTWTTGFVIMPSSQVRMSFKKT